MRRLQQPMVGHRGVVRIRRMRVVSRFWSVALLATLTLMFIIPSRPISAGINVWTSIGPEGGTMSSLAIDPLSPSTLYAGTASGVFKSTNSGASWSAINIGLTSTSIKALAINPATPSIIYAGGFGGMFKSIDSGASWSAANAGLTNTFVQALVMTSGTLYAGTFGGGVFKSIDGGVSWSAVNAGMNNTDVRALAIDPVTPNIIYAGTFGGGVFKSTNDGASWSAISSGLTNTFVNALAINPTTPNILYVGTSDGVFKSIDSGTNWSLGNIGFTASWVDALVIDPTTTTTLYAGTSSGGVFRSINSGGSWNSANSGLTHTGVAALAINPRNSATLYLGTYGGGVFKSTDRGASWNVANTGLIQTKVNDLAIDPTLPTTIYAGTEGGVFKSTDRGTSWSIMNTGLTSPSVNTIAIDPANPATLYAGTFGGVFKSTNGGASWSAVNTGLTDTTVQALAVDPTAPATLYAGTRFGGGAFKSTNGGANWTTINTGLTNSDVFAIVIDSLNPSTLYAGTVGGGVFKSTNGGASWGAANTGLTNSEIYALAINPAAPSTLFAGAFGGVYKSTDGAASWNPILTGLTWALTIDPRTPTTLYIGRSDAVYRSADGGSSWDNISAGLTNTDVRTLAIDPATPAILYAGTASGGAFIFENVDEQALTYAKVVDQRSEPVAGARIYHNGRLIADSTGKPLLTDFSGNLILEGVQIGDALVALAPIHEQPTVRQGHDGWAYQVNVSNLTVGADSGIHPFAVTTPTGPQILTVRPQNPLVLFNLVVAIEWDANDAYLSEIERSVRSASDFLYDMTDGQMAFGQVAIYEQPEQWVNADIQIAASNIVRPHAYVGGLTDADRAHVIRLGRAWDGNSGSQGAWDQPDGYHTLAHEFGHYGIYLYDEYFAFVRDAQGNVIGERPASCTGLGNRSSATAAVNASVMDYQYASSELAMRDVPGLWSSLCQLTAQWQINGESDWETLIRKYADAQVPPRWQFTTPADRGGVLAGPNSLPSGILNLPQVTIYRGGAAPPRRLLAVSRPDGTAQRDAIVALYRQNGQVVGQGLTDTRGELYIYGAEAGDTLRAASFDGGLAGNALVGQETSLRMTLAPIQGLAARSNVQSAGMIPHLRVVANPGTSASQTDLLVAIAGLGPGADPGIIVSVPGGQTGFAPTLSYNAGADAYEGRMSFNATERGTGRIQALAVGSGSVIRLQSTYRLQRVTRDQGHDVFSDDGNLSLRLDPGSLPGVDAYIVAMSPGALPGPLPPGLSLVGDAYDVTMSGGLGALERPARLMLRYDRALVNRASAPEGLAIYRWDPNSVSWTAESSSLDDDHRALTAPIMALGTYALLAPPGAWTQPAPRLTFMPMVAR
jgi:photosystem II stability/assembly factor-like uncharacterized protein